MWPLHICLCRKRKITEMSADRSAASDSGPVVSRTRGLVSDRPSPSRRVPSLCFDTCATALETHLLPAVLHAHPPATSTDCPTASDGASGDSPSYRPVADRPLHFPGHAPPAVLRRFGRATARYADRSMGSRHQSGTASGIGCQSLPIPPPSRSCWRSNSDCGKRYVLGRNRESRSRPRNVISRELTSLANTDPNVTYPPNITTLSALHLYLAFIPLPHGVPTSLHFT